MVTAPAQADDEPMTDDQTTTHSDGPGANPTVGGFTRSRRDRMIAGVAGGVAERLDVDPFIVRAAFVVLAVAGGSGVLLYLLGWLLLPEEGEAESIAGRHLGTPSWDSQRARHTVFAVLIALAFLAVVHPWHWSFGGSVFIAIALVAVAALSRSRGAPAPPVGGPPVSGPAGGAGWGPPAGGPPVSGPTAGAATTPGETTRPEASVDEDTAGQTTLAEPIGDEGSDAGGPDLTTPFSHSFVGGASPTTPWSPPVVRRPKSLIPILLAGLAVLAAVSAGIAATGWVSVALPVVVIAALLMTLAALIAGAQRGRFLGAILISVPLAAILVLSAAVPHPLAGGVGQRTWHPADPSQLKSSYRLGTGQAAIDLSDVKFSGPRTLRASVGTGDLTVTVPAGAVVQVRERAAIGSAEAFGNRQGGISVDRTSVDAPAGGGPALDLDLKVGIGSIEVRRAAA
jgi:phage shock protein PspC (stress-responsive transcriptional regulator)